MSCCEKVEKNQENEQTPKLIFTRYLYIKNEVEISLLSAILNKKNDESLFWAFELYYSGFTNDLLYLIWRIYFEFYATLNPTFEAFFLIKEKEAKEKAYLIQQNNYLRVHSPEQSGQQPAPVITKPAPGTSPDDNGPLILAPQDDTPGKSGQSNRDNQ